MNKRLIHHLIRTTYYQRITDQKSLIDIPFYLLDFPLNP